MKRIILTLFLLLTLTAPSFAALSKEQARTKAKQLWGPRGRAYLGSTGTNAWIYQVGYDSTGCGVPFTVIGSSNVSFDDAFAAVPATAVAGPYSGIIELKASAWDNVGITEMRFRLNGSGTAIPPLFEQPAQNWQITLNWNTASVPNGVHHLCVTARDAQNNMGRSAAFLFRTNQSVVSVSKTMELPARSKTGAPIGFGIPLDGK